MEDEHTHKLCLNDEKDLHYFAVYDGHGGAGAAKYAAKHLHPCILNHPAFSKCKIIGEMKHLVSFYYGVSIKSHVRIRYNYPLPHISI